MGLSWAVQHRGSLRGTKMTLVSSLDLGPNCAGHVTACMLTPTTSFLRATTLPRPLTFPHFPPPQFLPLRKITSLTIFALHTGSKQVEAAYYTAQTTPDYKDNVATTERRRAAAQGRHAPSEG
jgi:hypothetical protein